MLRPDPREVALDVHAARYGEARVVLLAGSASRGDATATSDLDLVVVYERLDHAYRECFTWREWPVETFVHDPETLRYFMREVDRAEGTASLATMVVEGLELPGPSPFSAELKATARAVIQEGPPRLTELELRRRRYALTDLVDDLRSPRGSDELLAAGASLHTLLGDTWLRSRGHWSAGGKLLLRRLGAIDQGLAARYHKSFDWLFRRHDPQEVILLAEELLAPVGGLLFDGYRLDAPPSWRLPR